MARSRVKRGIARATPDKGAAVRKGSDSGAPSGYEVSAQLRDLLQRRDIPASARVHAARTLAEMDGLIGKHQTAPSHVPTAPLSGLSREELEAELNRLRTLVDLGLAR